MIRWRVGLAYDGAGFCGWGVQPDQRSVQKTLEISARQVFGAVGEVTAAGRTDAGVHATGQTIHLDLDFSGTGREVVKRLNAVLPEDVAATGAVLAPEGFHARYSCRAKEYLYRIANGPVRPVIGRRSCLWEPRRLELSRLRDAARRFEGTHDMTAFMNAGREVDDAVREILRCRVRRRQGMLEISVLGTGFLYNQVRIMVGTLVEVGLGKRTPETVTDLLAGGSRQDAGPTLPGQGLTLEKTIYPGDPAERRLPSQS